MAVVYGVLLFSLNVHAQNSSDITLAQARALVENDFKAHPGSDIVITDVKTFPIGWVFLYNTQKYVETHDRNDGLVGNGPILIMHNGTRVDLPDNMGSNLSEQNIEGWLAIVRGRSGGHGETLPSSP